MTHNELDEFTQIHIILLRNLLSQNVHLYHFFFSTMYVLSIAVACSDAGTICEAVCVFSAYCRYIFYLQRNQLVKLLRICHKLWVQLTVSEKVIVRRVSKLQFVEILFKLNADFYFKIFVFDLLLLRYIL